VITERKPQMAENIEQKFKSGFITVIGKPNVGKSTMINSLIGEKVAITSPKPQTTRSNLRAVITERDYQMIFIDTPGIHTPKNKLGEYMVSTAAATFGEVDVIVMVCDATDRSLSQNDVRIIEKLKEIKNKPVFLVINKTDAVRKELLLEKIQIYAELYPFREIIPLSALKREGIEILRNAILECLGEGPQYFPGNITADTTMRTIVSEIIREKILLNTNDEVPHGTGIEIIQYKEPAKRGGVTSIEANIYCEKATHKGIIIGKNGEKLKKIGTSARRDMERILGGQVNLKLWVKVKDDWRNSPGMLKELGFQ
jgi:GTP-binding protein era